MMAAKDDSEGEDNVKIVLHGDCAEQESERPLLSDVTPLEGLFVYIHCAAYMQFVGNLKFRIHPWNRLIVNIY